MAGNAATIAVLMIVVASVCLDVCQACGECGTPTVPAHKPPYKPPTVPENKPPHKPPTVPENKPPYKPPTENKPPQTPEAPTIPEEPTCPVGLGRLGVCSPLLGGIVGDLLPESHDCCALLNVLGLDVEICLCLALEANILGLISINAKVDAIVSILTSCGYEVPPKLSCPY